MNWIKVTPETMPPENERVFATLVDCENNKEVEVVKLSVGGDYWLCMMYGALPARISDGIKVTHWMPYPKPAED